MGGGVYLDTNAFVYAVQGAGEAASSIQTLLSEMDRRARKPFTSELTLAELLCKRGLSPGLQADYVDLLIESEAIELVPVSRDLLLASAAMSREGETLKLQDAIHFATAVHASCAFIVTNDQRFASMLHGMKIVRPTMDGVNAVLSALDV